MAETAPLVTARAHARKAAEETERIKWSEAADEYTQAASDYAKAARSTSDFEALRILRLLEEQHRQLARLVKLQDLAEPNESTITENKHFSPSESKPVSSLSKKSAETKPTTSRNATSATRFGNSQVRDSSPSLARDIASRRGIPQPGKNPPSAAAQARARQLSPDSRRRNRPAHTPNIPPSIMDSQDVSQAAKANKAEDDDAFSKFYSDLTTGTMSKLSSVLAYAGLPLTANDITPDQHARQKKGKQTVPASNEPDVKKIFSKAALNAIEEEHRQRGARGHVFGPAESFYVVQKGGGTYSYADIAKAHQQQMIGFDQEDEDAFVDAREAPMQTASSQSRQSSLQPRIDISSGRTQEELELENVTLKQTLEQVATRLAQFETHSQDISMAALTQSMVGSHPQTANEDSARVMQLERQIEQQAAEMKKLKISNKNYKTQWNVIVESAKKRHKAGRGDKSEQNEGEESPAGGETI